MQLPSTSEAIQRDEALKASLAVLPVGIFTVDSEGKLLVVSGGAFDSLGVEHLVPGQFLFDHPSLPFWIVQRVGHALRTGEASEADCTENGRSFHLALRPIRTSGDRIAWVVGSLQELPRSPSDDEQLAREQLLFVEREARARA